MYSRDKGPEIARAWRDGRAMRTGSAFRTDGLTAWSYDHVIGYTQENGLRKVAIDCHYSLTTARHVGRLVRYADEVVPCGQHPYSPRTRQPAARPYDVLAEARAILGKD